MRIFMDIQQMLGVKRRLESLAEQTNDRARQVMREMQNLNQVWYGPAVTQYMQRQSEFLTRLQGYRADLDELIRLLEHEIQEYLIISRRLG